MRKNVSSLARAPNRLRELRLAQGLSHDALGARCVPPTSGSQILKLEKGPKHGGVRMDIDWMYRVAAGLGCHPSDLLPEPSPTAISIQERAHIDRYRDLGPDDRAAVDRVIEGLTKSDRPTSVRAPILKKGRK